jgi:hypothetical protein
MTHQFIARASSMRDLMTNPRLKSELLSATAKTAVQKAVLFDKYGIIDDISSKPIDKGIQLEPDAIEAASKVLGWFDVEPTKKRMINEYFTGEPDVLTPTLLADIKCSYSGLTFPWFSEEIPTAGYFYQLQVYMNLSGHRTSELVYCLLDTPEQMVLDEINRKVWKMLPDPKYSNFGQSEIELMADEQVRRMHNFAHIPIEKRIKKYRVDYDETVIKAMEERVTLCRDYYDAIYNTI